MILKDLVYPSAKRPFQLMQEISLLLQPLSYVSQIHLFGSLTHNHWDRWSDIDLLVVTSRRHQFWRVCHTINRRLPILHHHPLLGADLIGYHMLGNVFVYESVFHCLDLNFMSSRDIQKPHALDRFGDIVQLYNDNLTHPLQPDERDTLTPQKLTDDEEKISTAIHFTKKNIKKFLRQEIKDDKLEMWAQHLRETMLPYSFDYQVVGGYIGQVAQIYLSIADYLLEPRK